MGRAQYLLTLLLCRGREHAAGDPSGSGLRASMTQIHMRRNDSLSNESSDDFLGQTTPSGDDEKTTCKKFLRMDTDFYDTAKFEDSFTSTWITYTCPPGKQGHPDRNPDVGSTCDPCAPMHAVRYGQPTAMGWYCLPTPVKGDDPSRPPHLLCSPATPLDRLLTCVDGHWKVPDGGGPVCGKQLHELNQLLDNPSPAGGNSTLPTNFSLNQTYFLSLMRQTHSTADPAGESATRQRTTADAAEWEAATPESGFAQAYYWVGDDTYHDGPTASEVRGGESTSSYSWESLPTPPPTQPPDPEDAASGGGSGGAGGSGNNSNSTNSTNSSNSTNSTT